MKENKKESKICPVKDCNNLATEEFGLLTVCVECFTKCAYDMQPLILKTKSLEESNEE